MPDKKESAFTLVTAVAVNLVSDKVVALVAGNNAILTFAEFIKAILASGQGSPLALIYSGQGVPTFSARDGAMYMRDDGGPGARWYMNVSGVSTSGTQWQAIFETQNATDYTPIAAATASSTINAAAKRLFSVQIIAAGTAEAKVLDGVGGNVLMDIPANATPGTPFNINGGGRATNTLYWQGGANTPQVVVYWARQ